MNTINIPSRVSLRFVTSFVLGLLLTGPVSLRAQQTGTEASAGSKTLKLETFVVTGYADSLRKSMEEKRGSTEIKDVIWSEDIAQFPDANVAEALQRITGVQIQRTDGEGSYVSVRGVEPNLNLVTIDGRTASSGGFERAFDFSTLSADLVSGLEVIKSQSADMVEGGIGATIAITTPKPLNYQKDRVARLTAQTNYLSMTEKYSPQYSGLFSQKFMDGKMGALVTFSYQKNDQRTDSIGNNGWVRNAVANGPDKFTPRFFLIQSLVSEQERKGLNAAFQYQPSDKLLLTLNAKFDDYTTNQANNAFNIAHPGATGAGFVYNENNTAVSYSGVPGQMVPIQTYATRVSTSSSFGAEAVWKPADGWKVDLGLAYSESKTDSNPDDLVDLRVNFLPNNAAFANWTTTYTLHDGGAPDVDILNMNFLDQSQWGYRQMNLGRAINKNEEWAGHINLDYEIKRGFFTKFETGLRYSDRTIARPFSVSAAIQPPFATNVVPAGVLVPFPAKNFLDSSNADLPRSWMVADQAKALTYLAGNGFTFPKSTDLTSNPLRLFDINEKVSAAYAKMNFATSPLGIPVHGNVGVRYARTELTSSGSATVGTTDTPVSVNRTYGDVLPSITLVAEPRKNLLLRLSAAKAMTRPNLSNMAVSRTINLERIPVSINDGNPYLDPYRATQLDLSAEWYIDQSSMVSLALFHKKVKSFVSRVAATVPFTEELAPGAAIPIGDEVLLNSPQNLEGDTVKGFEVAFQKSFANLPAPFDGLGVTANYTYTQSGEAPRNLIFVDADKKLADGTFPNSAYVQLPLEGLSKNSYNFGAYYEKGRISIRAAYNWRDRYLLRSVGLQNTPLLQAAYGQWDGRVMYRLTQKLKVTLDSVNITDRPSYGYYTQDTGAANPDSSERISSYQQTGRRVSLSLSYDF